MIECQQNTLSSIMITQLERRLKVNFQISRLEQFQQCPPRTYITYTYICFEKYLPFLAILLSVPDLRFYVRIVIWHEIAKMSSRLRRISLNCISCVFREHKTHIIFILMFRIIRTYFALESSESRDVAVLTSSVKSIPRSESEECWKTGISLDMNFMHFLS